MRNGFSLVEVLIVTTVTLFLGAILIMLLVNNSSFFYQQNSLINQGMSLNDITQEIDRNIRESAMIAGGYPVESPVYLTSATTLILKLPAINGTTVINGVYDYVVIHKDNTNANILKLELFPDIQSSRQSENKVLTSLLKTIQFSYKDKTGNFVSPTSAVTVEAEVTVVSKGGSLENTQSAKVITSLRNFSQ